MRAGRSTRCSSPAISAWVRLTPCASALFVTRRPTRGVARMGRLLAGKDHLAHPLAVEGPLDDELGRLGELLLVAHFLWRIPDSNVSRFYRRTRPDVVEAAST